jgi:hypothetical protein
LSAKLDFVSAMQLRLTALEFDGIRCFPANIGLELDQIGDAGNPEPARRQWQSCDTPRALPAARARLVRGKMHNLSLGREPVLRPHAFQMNQRGLTEAINRVLKCG